MRWWPGAAPFGEALPPAASTACPTPRPGSSPATSAFQPLGTLLLPPTPWGQALRCPSGGEHGLDSALVPPVPRLPSAAILSDPLLRVGLRGVGAVGACGTPAAAPGTHHGLTRSGL